VDFKLLPPSGAAEGLVQRCVTNSYISHKNNKRLKKIFRTTDAGCAYQEN